MSRGIFPLVSRRAYTLPVLALVALLIQFPIASPAMADRYAEAREVFENAGESAAYFDNSYGYALFPNIGRGGIGIGGARGRGRVFVGGELVGEVTMTQVTIGLQLGGQAYRQIIFFEDERAFKEFTSGNFEFGAEASAVAITAGAGAEAGTAGGTRAGASTRESEATALGGYHKGMAVFTVARGGLMYQATIGGQKFSYEPL